MLHLNIAKELLRPGRESQLISEAKDAVHMLEEVKASLHLRPDLVGHAEDVGVVLLEPSHPCQACQSAGQLVPVEHPKVSHPQREVFIGTCGLVEHDAVTRTVHWFQAESLLLDADLEHVLCIVVPMARGLPQLGVVDVWTDNLAKPTKVKPCPQPSFTALIINFLTCRH